MPHRQAFRENRSHDFHTQHGFQSQPPQLAIVDPDSVDYTGWHEMDFTTAPLTSSLSTSDLQQALNQKYLAAMDRNVDSLPSVRSATHRQGSTGSLANSSSHRQSPDVPTISGDLYTTGPFSYSQLLNMDADLSSMAQSSLSSSRADCDSNMLNDDDTLTTTMSVSDSLNTSPPVATVDPIAISIQTKNDPSEKLCPLIAGQVDNCQPSRCGPDAPCMNFTTLPPIEECTSVPCITQSTSPNETMITSDSMSVSLHSRPSAGSRTNTTSTSRTSLSRRTSGSSNDNQAMQSVPLPPRRTTAASTRRKARTAPVKTSPTAESDDEAEEEQGNNKSTAPSKTDAKQRAKQAHSLVERKYRENLNAKIAQLHNTLQSSHYGPKNGEEGDSDIGDAAGANSAGPKVRKSDVLTEAMNYVNQTEVEMRHMENELQRLSERVRVLEKLVRCEDCSLLKQMVNLQVQAV